MCARTEPAIPSCTVEGVFGIARTTGTPGESRPSILAVGIAAATLRICSGRMSPTDLSEEHVDVLRLHADDHESRARSCVVVRERRIDTVPLAELRDALGASAGCRDLSGLAPATRAVRR